MAEYRCNNTEQYKTRLEAVEQGKSRLQNNRPLVLVQDALPGWSKEKTTDAYLQGVGRWSKVADIKWAVITDLAEAGPKDVVNLITVADLGDDGVLADQVLPNGSTRILPMRMNSRIRWILTDGPMNNGVDAARVFLHEGGHFIDHQHWPRGKPDEVMEPYISDNIWVPQPTEAAVTAQWFGIPGQTPDPTPTPTPTPNPCPTICQGIKTLVAVRNRLRRGASGGEIARALLQGLAFKDGKITDRENPVTNEQFDALASAAATIPCDKITQFLTSLVNLCPQQPAAKAIAPCAGLAGLVTLIQTLGPIIQQLGPICQQLCPQQLEQEDKAA